MKILVINGPNMNLLGHRNAAYYGSQTLPEIEARLRSIAAELNIEISFFQSNHEGAICDTIATAISDGTSGIVINPAAYTHTSIALHDALEAASIPTIEVHMSNIAARESFRYTSLTLPVCLGQFTGLGADVYEWALRALVQYIAKSK